MEMNKFYIQIGMDKVARDMTLECATLLIKAMFESYWRERGLAILIGQEDKAICEDKL